MEFDKSKVYTAVNADELKTGSKVYVSDNFYYLKECVEENEGHFTLDIILSEKEPKRFCVKNEQPFALAYLIEPPDEPKYKPFTNLSSLVSGTNKHYVYIKSKKSVIEQIVGMTLNNDVVVDGQNGRRTISVKDLLENYVFERDGSPCGELAEE